MPFESQDGRWLSELLDYFSEHDSKSGSGMKSTPEEVQTRESVKPTHNPDEQTPNPDEQMHNPIEQTYNPPEVESL